MARLGDDAAAPMEFSVSVAADGVTTVALAGELDTGTVEQLSNGVAGALDPPPARLIVDLSELRFADSSAIALWVRWSGIVGTIELHGASPLLRRVVTTMGLADKLGLQ
jgi:anti-anti-sigma factor